MSAVIKATKTLAAIETMIAADQGAAYRGHLGRVIPHIGDAYRSEPETFRSHMGASLMGSKCGRKIWYSFRWATASNFTGRLMRLFNRGHLEEARFIAILLTIGMEVWQQDEHGKQFRISGSAGHYGGSGDGVGRGCPDLPPDLPCLLEFKTHNDASFKELVKLGTRNAKFEHWIQCQQYMRKMGLTAALYIGVNKNDDNLYAEIIPVDYENADTFIERADKIVWMQRAPERIGSPPSPGNFDCKWCDHRPVCFLKQAPARNCRTCVYAAPSADGDAEWRCNEPRNAPISPIPLAKPVQLTGCAHYTQHPDMGT